MTHTIEQGFQDAGIRAIAEKIKTRLHDLEKTVENNKGRWAWELLQNAKDSVVDTKRNVSVQIELSKDKVEFRHNGKHFDEQDIIGIINQISSKEVAEGEKTKRIGRFGTGFLTTHLLSKVIEIQGIFESSDGEFSNFKFSLDRNGNTTEILIPKIEKARKDFLKSINGNKLSKHDINAFNTSFSYILDTPEKNDIARVGTDEFSKLVPFVLAAIPAISKVEIIDNINNSKIKFENNHKPSEDFIIEITKTENDIPEPIKLLFVKDNDVSISALLTESEEGYEIQSLKDIPKLFCDFPLIGTENFYFPVIVNSFDFIPKTERDGIWLKKDDDLEVQKNRELLEKSVGLFQDLLPKLSEGKYFSLYNIADTRNPVVDKNAFDEDWFSTNIQVPLRKFIETIPLVDTVRNGRIAIVTEEFHVDFPAGDNKSETEIIWGLANIEECFLLPQKKDIHFWNEILWTNEYDFNEEGILCFVQESINIETLKKSLGEKDVYEWLNELYEFAIGVKENIKVFEKYSSIPNQKGDFKKRTQVSKDEIIDDTLKQVALKLKNDYYNLLLHSKIIFNECSTLKNKQEIATIISNEINQYRKSNDENDEIKIAIRLLTRWLDENAEEEKKYFSSLYRIKEKLLVETIEDKANLYLVLSNEKHLATLAKVAEALKNDPEILALIENLIREKKELGELKIIGEYFEEVLAEALREQGFKVDKVIVGRDLIIQLKNNTVEYSIEVKSTKSMDFVSMTPAQGKSASSNSDNYALCVIYNDGSIPDVDYIKTHAKLILDIGEKLKVKVGKVVEFENSHAEISNFNEDIVLFFENGLNYKYQISNKIWSIGKTFEQFIKYISDKQTKILEAELRGEGKQI